jgi:hypothetical protein
MGEIKSTLDLIMERTKNLSMSPEEKEENRRQEWLKKARGWIQRFLDDRVPLDKAQEELFSSTTPPKEWSEMLKEELVAGLDPVRDNEKRLLLMETLLGIPVVPYRDIIASFNQMVDQEEARQKNRILEQWAQQGISGSALVPNLEGDSFWKEFFEQTRKTTKEKMADL